MPDSQTDKKSSNDKSHIDNRHLFRQIIVQKLYELEFKQRASDMDLADRETDYDNDLELEFLSSKLARKLRRSSKELEPKIEEIRAYSENIDAVIKTLAPAWPIEQINPVDLQILRLGIFEGFIVEEIPEKVAIDEAIELARDFGGESNVKFVSGVLGNLYANKKMKATLKKKSEDEQDK